MISIKSIFISALRNVFLNLKFVTLFWITNLTIAFALTLPLFSALNDNLKFSSISQTLVGNFDLIWLIQFRNIYQTSLDAFPPLLIAFAILYIFIQIFYQGGLISIFINNKKNHTVDFFFGAVKYFYRFFKVSLVMFFFYFIAVSFNTLMHYAIDVIFVDSNNQMLIFIFDTIRFMIFLFLMIVINVISDYTKINIVVNDSSIAIRAIMRTIIFIKNNIVLILIVYLSLTIIVIIFGILYNFLEAELPSSTLTFLFVTFLFQQVLIIFRIIFRMLFYATGVALFVDASAEVIEATTEDVNLGVK